MHIIFVVQSAPNPIGHGSNHRAYQVAHDLREVVGPENVTIFDYGAESRALSAAIPIESIARQQLSRLSSVWFERLRRLRQMGRERRNGWRGWLQERNRLLSLLLGGPAGDGPPGANRTLARYDNPRVLARYFEQVADLPRPLICVVRHSNFARLAWANRRLGIRTVACPANLEAFDVGVTHLNGRQREMYLTALNFGDELAALAACDARLFISRVECGLVNGLGFPSQYYPYRPVGAIRQAMVAIREERAGRPPTPGLFLMLGSGDHPTTGESFRWFLQEMRAQPLPDGVRIVVCGRKTDELLPRETLPPAVTVRGWVEQEELQHLLESVQGVLLPQRVGFGGLTRLAELSCAGVPGIVSTHATHAVQPMPPGFVAVGDSWCQWQDAIQQSLQHPPPSSSTETIYKQWEESQSHLWGTVLAQVMND